jgi:hypothetical protein
LQISVIAGKFAPVFVGLALLAPGQKAMALENPAIVELLRYACTAVAGEFEDGWVFDQSGAYWFETAACVTADVRLYCNDGECKAVRSVSTGDATVAVKDKASPDLGFAVYPDKGEFDRVLRGGGFY